MMSRVLLSGPFIPVGGSLLRDRLYRYIRWYTWNQSDKLDQFDDCHLSCVTAARTDLDDAAVTAVSLFIFWSDIIKDLLCDSLFCNVRINLTLGMEVILLCLCDDLSADDV